jgi:hypothetical protein
MNSGPFGPFGLPDHPVPFTPEPAFVPPFQLGTFVKDQPFGPTVSDLSSALGAEGGMEIKHQPTFQAPFGWAESSSVAVFVMCAPFDADRTFVMVLATSSDPTIAEGIRNRVRANISVSTHL